MTEVMLNGIANATNATMVSPPTNFFDWLINLGINQLVGMAMVAIVLLMLVGYKKFCVKKFIPMSFILIALFGAVMNYIITSFSGRLSAIVALFWILVALVFGTFALIVKKEYFSKK